MNAGIIQPMLAGTGTVGCWAITLFFLRFWKQTRDRLFIFFGVAFALLGIERLALGLMSYQVESYFYLIRLFAFLLILYAIVDKNRKNGA